MALSMEEQRILAEIEEHFAKDEPALAGRLAKLERPRPSLAGVLRSPRGRLLASLAAVFTLVLMSMLVYLVISVRGMPHRGAGGRPGTGPTHQSVSALKRHPSAQPPRAGQFSAGQSGTGQLGTGQFSTGQGSTGQGGTGQGSTGQRAPGAGQRGTGVGPAG